MESLEAVGIAGPMVAGLGWAIKRRNPTDCGLVIGDCGFLDWGLRIERVDWRLRLAIEIADLKLAI